MRPSPSSVAIVAPCRLWTLPARLAVLLAVTWCLGAPGAVEAQITGQPNQGSTPFLLGVRGGLEVTNSDWILGIHSRFGIPGIPILDVQVAGELTFVDPPAIVGGGGFEERSFDADLLLRRGALAVGGGVVVRNSYWVDLNTPRETRTGWSGVLVLGGIPGPRSLFSGQLEYRYSRVSGIGYSALTAGVSVAPLRLLR